MYGTCNWCQQILKAPDDYDRRVHVLYCSQDCVEKDWLFQHWQNDKYLTWIASEFVKKGGASEPKV